MLINTTDLDWKEDSQAIPGHVAQTDGGDIIFTAGDGITKLNHEIEKYDETTGELVAWVEVSSLSGTNNTDIYIYYGNTSLGVDENQWNTAGVWDSDYVGVWHLKETSGDFNDSTSNANTGTDNVSATGKTGVVGPGQEFSGNGDSIQVPHKNNLNITGPMSISFWIYPTQDTGQFNRVVDKGYTTSYYFGCGDGTNDLTYYLDGNEIIDTADVVLSVNDWNYASVTYNNSGDVSLFLNGSEIWSGNYALGITGNTDTLYISYSDSAWDFPGFIDEVRISKAARSAAWIQTEYDNQRAPAAFYTVGIEETTGTGADPFNNGWTYRKRITIDSVQVSCDLTNFPVLINTTDPDLTAAQANFNDILFTAADGNTKLDHEIEKYNSATGEIVAWVEVRSVSSTTDTDIYIYYATVRQWTSGTPRAPESGSPTSWECGILLSLAEMH